MSQMQEDEQQEEAKKPGKNALRRWLFWFTVIGASLLSFFMIWLTVDRYDHGDWWQAFLFVLVGGGFYLLLCLWQPMKVRVVGIMGSLLWSLVAWPVGYASVAANMQDTSSRIGIFAYQLEVIYGASVPFILLFFVFFLLLNRDLAGK